MKIKFIILALITASTSLFGHHRAHGKSFHHCSKKEKKCKTPAKENCLVADVIVIGGGAAGCILMNQLSENGCYSVLGIEAGANVTNEPEIQEVGLPALLLPGTAGYKFFWWGWKQVKPQITLDGRIGSDWITGFCLGGGSSVNGLYYGRGSNSVYSQWEEVSGSHNWSLDNILATFNKLENYQGLSLNPGARGENGPVNVLQTPTKSQITEKVFLPACRRAFPHIPTVEDYNDPLVVNCIDPRAQWLIDPTGTKRVSSATAFLDETVMTPQGCGVNGHTLRIIFNSVVLKIVFDEQGRAKKVRFVKDGQLCEACARKAVILAGGINSSKLLQLSGIGPRKTLEKAGIKPVFINENVGKNLQNHPLITFALTANPNDNGIPEGAPYAYTIQSVYLPVVGGTSSDPRMLQILCDYIPPSPLVPFPLVACGFELLNPKSKGDVNIQSDNSFQIAAVNDGFYRDPEDFQNMVSAVRVYIKDLLFQLAAINPPFYRPVPGDPINALIPDFKQEDVERFVRNNTNLVGDGRHFSSHCKMAPLDEGGVVDGDTRVYGTTNCFVTDCSICPVIPDINTTGPSMMIGLRSSEILKRVLCDIKSEK